jgi:glycosyltransferase involved in cell wall biosynthesis
MGVILIDRTDRLAASVTKVSTVFLRHSHHSRHSGYPCFADRLGAFVDVRRLEPWRLPEPLLTRVAGGIVYEWFDHERLRLDLTAARRLVTARCEIVHLLYGETDHFYAGRVRRIGRMRGNRLIATFHQPPALLDELVPAPALFEQLDHAIALGPRAEAHLAGLVGGPERVSRAFLAVDTDAWHPRPERRAEVPTCAVVGSWFRDFEQLGQVIELVRAGEPHVRFELVTAPGRVDEFGALRGVRARAGISEDDLREVYWSAWVNVLPLKDAVANNALLEGMASGLATVVSEVGDVSDYSGPDGARLVPARDGEAMAAAVLELLADGDAREKLGRRARARAVCRDLTAGARRHAEIYAGVSGSGRDGTRSSHRR